LAVAHPAKNAHGLIQSTAPALTTPTMPLTSVKDYSFVLQNLATPGAVTTLAQSKYDMLIVDPTATLKGNAGFDMAGMVSQLHQTDPGRVVLAYLNIGEAGCLRSYWQNNWKAPTANHHGSPSFLLTQDPYGYADNYPVAYWSPAWQKLYTGKNGIVADLMKAGFDGVCVDWVAGYGDSTVAAAARRAGVNPAKAMVQFVSRIRGIVKANNPAGVVVGEGAVGLAAADPAYLSVIDAGLFEDTWFYGTPNSAWGDPAGGDLPIVTSDTASLVSSYKMFQSDGKPVFTLDMALQSPDAELVYAESSQLGFVPLVTQVSLAQTTTTPPPWLT
jgi:cysteinyl-tRNA synthetase